MAALAAAFVGIACFLQFVDVRLEVLIAANATPMAVPVNLGVAREIGLSVGLLLTR